MCSQKKKCAASQIGGRSRIVLFDGLILKPRSVSVRHDKGFERFDRKTNSSRRIGTTKRRKKKIVQQKSKNDRPVRVFSFARTDVKYFPWRFVVIFLCVRTVHAIYTASSWPSSSLRRVCLCGFFIIINPPVRLIIIIKKKVKKIFIYFFLIQERPHPIPP